MMQVIATIAKIHVWKYLAWFVPSSVNFIAMPMAFILITCKTRKPVVIIVIRTHANVPLRFKFQSS
jgi:hypothetical protein